MDFPLQFSAPTGILIFWIIAPIMYYFFHVSRKPSENKTPPVVGGAWPVIGHLHLLAGPQPPHITLGNLADKYGPIFTIKFGVHRTLIVSNWQMAKEFLTTHDKIFASRPNSLAMDLLGYNQLMFGFSPYGPFWRQIRKIVTLELLSNHRLEMLKHVREGEVQAATEGLYRQWIKNNSSSGTNQLMVEMKKWFWDITLNVILKLLVGKRYVEYSDSIKGEDSGGWRDALRTYVELSGEFAPSDALPYLKGRLDLGGVERKMKKTAKDLDDIVQGWLEEHKQKKASGVNTGHEDFMDVMLSVLEESKELSTHNADTINKATILALVLAASETTSVTLTWTLALLLNNRDALKKVQEELDIHVGRERRVTESDMKNLTYLQVVLKESFRLYPAVPLLLPHESMEDCAVGDYHIPAGTRLFVNVAKMHRDPQVWSNANEFQPERFLTTHKDVDFRGQDLELIPFSSGRRMCPGVSFALQVLNLTLGTLLQGFEIDTPFSNPVDMTESSGLTNLKATPLDVILTPRLPAHLYEKANN